MFLLFVKFKKCVALTSSWWFIPEMSLFECPVGLPTTLRPATNDDTSTLSWTEAKIRLMYTDHENHSQRGRVCHCWVKDHPEWIPYKWWIEAVWCTWARPVCQPACTVLSIGHLMWLLSWFLTVGAGKPDLSEGDQLSQVTHFMVELGSKSAF